MRPLAIVFSIFWLASLSNLWAQKIEDGNLLGEAPNLGPLAERTTQEDLQTTEPNLFLFRQWGVKIFATPFNPADGLGSGEANSNSFQGIRLQAQSCLSCHQTVSTRTNPPRLGLGGFSPIPSLPVYLPSEADLSPDAAMDHLVLPPPLFGLGGVSLLAQEMTKDLQALKEKALASPGTTISLISKGVDFGTVIATRDGNLDTSAILGIDEDLIVRPYGRKGDYASIREISKAMFQFHMGIQAAEFIGQDTDEDNDGVSRELLVGELSALEIFLTTQDRPVVGKGPYAATGVIPRFTQIGCADCHVPAMTTDSNFLTYSFPETPSKPSTQVFYQTNLGVYLSRFQRSPQGGLIVRLFSDLKRHDMGPDLGDEIPTASETKNREFLTAKLWGLADRGPYLHDGRARTVHEAILAHGGEAQNARDRYDALTTDQKNEILGFLQSLQAPHSPNSDIVLGRSRETLRTDANIQLPQRRGN